MNKVTALLMSLVLLLAFGTAAQGAAEPAKPISVWLGEHQLQLDSQVPLIQQSTTLVPVEPLLKELGFTVSRDEQSKAVSGAKDNLTISIQAGKHAAVVNGQQVALLVAPKTIGKVTYAPVRFIAEAAGYKVLWNAELRTVVLQTQQASKGFLWKVENNGSTVYLLGSIHVASKEMYPLRPAIEQAFSEADYLTVEVDISKPIDAETQSLVASLSTYSDGTKLQDHISPESYKKVGEFLTGIGQKADAFDAFKPWNISLALNQIKWMNLGYDSSLGIDAYFLNKAKESMLPVLELESIKLQLELFDGFSPEFQEKQLLSSLESLTSGDSDIKQMSEAWAAGDEKALLESIQSLDEEEEEYTQKLLVDRNIPMTEHIDAYLKKGDNKTYFVVVGAAHLIGEWGIVPLLEGKGYTVARQ
ncbi:hypothetical protein PAECIP111893_00532 [Paenibacillus plantiphilus]|uniref:Copper amine oxidase-like N-terminal domain-containing protein n=1 Tax=Paenibacillus plantiphilus TaxID=2905650 RepID=A0ABM9BSK2_9BACL|nr:TraB/GumN family protein [Paenibacillus plantiphilus]CAH1193702.1 hypothetical protein PAECIP111893_00532 [Paenibacillus plantiphilus]